jgi:PKD repeat protein
VLSVFCFGLVGAQTTMTFQGGVTMVINNGTSMNILGNVVFQPSSQVDNSGNIFLTGDWTNNSGSTALINSSPGMVEFYGDTQRISGSDATRFYDLTLTGTGIKMLEVHAEAEGTLDLTDRELRTDTFDMYVSNSGAGAISRTTGYVSSLGNGRLRRNTASTNTYLFPIGDPASGGTYRPIELAPSSSAANTFDVRFVLDDPTNAGYNRANRDSSFCTVNDGFFHFIEQSAGTSSTDVTMYYDSTADGSFTQIGGWLNVPQWQNTSTATGGQSGGLDYLSISSWSDFTYGVFALGKGVEKPTLVTNGPLTFCAPGSLIVTTSIGYDTIVWNTGSTDDTITVTSTQDIYAWVADQNGCSAYSDTISINVQPLPNANFNSSTAGFTATFTNTSTNGTTYSWDFGDGNNSSVSNPSHTYSANGTYNVCLIATNSCGNDTTCKSVIVNCPTPNTNFNYTTNNLAVTFNDNSTGGATSYTWDYGDGNSGSGANTNHTYSSPGTYTVCLITQNSCGFDTACSTVNVTCPAPNSSYTYAANNLSVNFTNGSTGGATSYSWDFGDGNGSTSTSPSHNYSTPGTYTVCLISSSICGNDTVCQNVNVVCPLPSTSFGYNASNLSVSFTNSTTGANNYSWDFGDGNVGSGATPTHNYSTPGIYTVCMIASNNCGSDTVCQNVNVVCPVPNGSFGYTSNNLSISFNNSTTGAQSYTWDFGDGNSGSGATPTHNYTTPGTYTVCMIAANNCGNDTVCQNINVVCPIPNSGFGYNTTSLTMSLTNNSSGANSYAWDFGDGSTSSIPNPSHTYTQPGTYTVCLIAINSCGNDTTCQNVTVTCTLPSSAYTYSTNNQTVNFSDQSSGGATGWLWTFGDGNRGLTMFV